MSLVPISVRGITVSPTSLPVGEGRTATYTVVLNSIPTGDVMVTPNTSAELAVTVSGALTFTTSNWATPQTVTLTGVEDTNPGSETVTISHLVTGGGYGGVRASDVTVTTIDNEAAAAVMVWIDSPTEIEGENLTFTISVNRLPAGGAKPRVFYRLATDPGTSEDSDRTFSAGHVTIRSGTAATFTVGLRNDTRPEFDETIRVELYNPSNATIALGGSIGVGTIIDNDDSTVAIISTDGDVREGLSLRIRVRLDPVGDRPVTVDYATSAAGVVGVPDAVAGTHYTALQGTLTFAADEMEKSVTLDTLTDSLHDFDRNVAFEIFNPTGGAEIDTDLGRARQVYLIRNKENLPIVNFTDPTVEENAGDLVFEVTLSQASAQTVTVDYADAGTGSATSGHDYTPIVPGTLTFPPGTTGPQTISVAVTNDAVIGEGRENVGITLSNVMNAGFSGEVAFEILDGGILDDDVELFVDFAIADAARQVGETYIVDVSGVSDANTYAAMSSNTNVATVAVAGHTLTVTAVSEGTATISVDLSRGSSSATATFEFTVTPQPVISITTAQTAVSEGANVVFTVTASPPTPLTVSLNIAQTGGYVAAGDVGAKTVVIPSGGTATYTVATVNDMVVAPNGTVTATLAAGAGYALSPTQRAATVAVNNDTRGVTVSAAGTGVTVAEGGGTAQYTVVLIVQPTGNVTVTPSSGDTAIATVSGALTFTTGNWNAPQTVTVTGVEDSIVNPGNQRTVSITHAVSGGGYDGVSAAPVAVTVTDNDIRGVTVSKTELSLSEGAGGTYTVRLNTEPTDSVTITPISGAPAVATVSPAVLTFRADNWNMPQTVTVTGVDDNVDDLDAVRTATISHTVAGADYGANGVTAADVMVTVR